VPGLLFLSREYVGQREVSIRPGSPRARRNFPVNARKIPCYSMNEFIKPLIFNTNYKKAGGGKKKFPVNFPVNRQEQGK
jgi:hypothetical protein